LTDNVQPYLHPGKDNYNPAIAEFANVQEPDGELLDRNKDPRMPWHDIHMMCDGYAARDVAINFIQRWNHHRDCLNQHHYIVPSNKFLPYTGNLSVQVIRSTCNWSSGVAVTETSILNAYLAEIEKAENFIYIENQFFISSNAGRFVENTISQAILNKVFDAVKNNRVCNISQKFTKIQMLISRFVYLFFRNLK
jgi:phospholipase D1/2